MTSLIAKSKSFLNQLSDVIIALVSYPFTRQERRRIDEHIDSMQLHIDIMRHGDLDNREFDLDMLEHHLKELSQINAK